MQTKMVGQDVMLLNGISDYLQVTILKCIGKERYLAQNIVSDEELLFEVWDIFYDVPAKRWFSPSFKRVS